MSQEPTDIRIDSAGPADRAEQVALYAVCFDKADGARVLPWRYRASPHGPSISFLARDAQDVTLSGYACSPRIVVPNGREDQAALVGETGDVMTHPDHRGRGVFSSLDRAAMEATREAGWACVFGLPNRQSAGIFTGKLGWSEVGQIRPFTFVLRADRVGRAERFRAGRVASWLTPLAVRRGRAVRRNLSAQADRRRVEPLERFGIDVTNLWKRVAPRWPWMVRRDADWLNWRFLDAPSGRFRALGIHQGGTLTAYAVVQVPEAGSGVGCLVDVLALDDADLAAAVEAALGYLEAQGASVVKSHAIVGSWWESRLLAFAFQPPKAEDQKIVIAFVHDADHPLGKAVLEPHTWYFTDGDRDDELVG